MLIKEAQRKITVWWKKLVLNDIIDTSRVSYHQLCPKVHIQLNLENSYLMNCQSNFVERKIFFSVVFFLYLLEKQRSMGSIIPLLCNTFNITHYGVACWRSLDSQSKAIYSVPRMLWQGTTHEWLFSWCSFVLFCFFYLSYLYEVISCMKTNMKCIPHHRIYVHCSSPVPCTCKPFINMNIYI